MKIEAFSRDDDDSYFLLLNFQNVPIGDLCFKWGFCTNSFEKVSNNELVKATTLNVMQKLVCALDRQYTDSFTLKDMLSSIEEDILLLHKNVN